MSQPWFDPNMYAWIPGTCLGVLGGLTGSLIGTLAPRGKAKGLVLGLLGMELVLSAILLGAGIVARATGQPYGVWYGLGLAGLVGTIVIGSLFPTAARTYHAAEQRRLAAQDLK